ncbi:S-type pyocin domain-containing protein [Pseudomonas sp. NPDC007930]|uniref:S-type pyocin domain-containing protein n=1 Tax=Pseudomonas sp. NPDC007930 TaxID=3364417 RepID=UPI0036E249B6
MRAAAEAARIAAEQAAIDSALTAPLHHTLSADAAIARPLFFSAVATYPVIENAGASISASLRTGLAVLADFAQATSKGAAVGIGLLLYSPKLGNAERMERTVTSIPLSLIAPELAAQLAAAAAAVDAQHTVSMPVRLATTPVPTEEAKSTLVVVKTGEAVRANVKAVYATHDPATKTYTAQTAEQPPRTLTWTPAISPPDSSTALPGESTIPENYDGPVVEPIEAKLLESPQPEPLDFDDLVVIFPADSGLPPIYVMYKSPRYEPGVVTGSGQVVGEDWLSAAATIGAPIPTQIAEQLIGLRFSSFDGLRRAVWRAIAQDPVLNAHFRSTQLPNMEKGLSPLVPKAQWRGKRKVMEVHHKNLISQGGAVYDLDNLFIMTPNAHVNIHCKGD